MGGCIHLLWPIMQHAWLDVCTVRPHNRSVAGIPPRTIPNGLDANDRTQGIILSGLYLSDP